MDLTQWYLILFFGVLTALGLRRSWLVFQRYSTRQLTYFLSRKLQYPLLIQRKYWTGVTRLQALCLVSYFLVNIAAISLPPGGLRDVEKRAAVAAVANLTPLFLGGRTNPLVDVMGIALPSYYLWHHWIGRIAIAEALIHSIIVVTLRPRPGPMITSGSIASVALLSILISSFCLCRKHLGARLRTLHGLLALAVAVATIWHVFYSSYTPAKVLACAAPMIWFLTASYRIMTIKHRGTGARIVGLQIFRGATRIEVYTKRPIRPLPGSYFYVSFTKSLLSLRVFNNHPMVAAWYQPHELSSEKGTRNISFIMSHRGRHARYLHDLQIGQFLLLEGPYGQDLRLKEYENVVLIAKGIGILGLLPLALYLGERSRHDDSIGRTLQEWPRRLEEWTEEQKAWEEEKAALSSEMEELEEKRTNLKRTKRGRMLEETLERESRSLEKELKLLNEQGKALRWERIKLERERDSALATPLFRDSARHIDIFWSLDYNDQFEWMAKYFKALQKLDPFNKLFVVWCDFPSPLPPKAKAPMRSSNYWLCLYPDERRQSFNDMVISTIETEAASPGRTVVISCGDATFVDQIRNGVIRVSRPDKLIEFLEVEYQPRSGTPNTATTDNLTVISDDSSSIASSGWEEGGHRRRSSPEDMV